MTMLQTLPLLAFPALAIVAALSDVVSYTIPNRLTAAVALAFIPAALLLGLPLPALGLALLIGFAALIAGMAMFAFNWIGGGDAKLFAACAMWMGLPGITPFLMWTALGGGGLAVLLLILRRRTMLGGSSLVPAWGRRLMTDGESVPYGVAIAAGALIAFPASLVAGAAHF